MVHLLVSPLQRNHSALSAARKSCESPATTEQRTPRQASVTHGLVVAKTPPKKKENKFGIRIEILPVKFVQKQEPVGESERTPAGEPLSPGELE